MTRWLRTAVRLASVTNAATLISLLKLAVVAMALFCVGACSTPQQSSAARHADTPAWKQCTDQSISDDAQIAGCSSVIASGEEQGANLAEAYFDRCEAFLGRSERQTLREQGLIKSTPREDEDLAFQDCNRAIELKPDYEHAYATRALLYDSKHDYDHAIADYDAAIKLRPDVGLNFAFRGSVYASKGDYDRAIADCTHAQQLGQMLAGFDTLCLKNATEAKARLAAGQKLGDKRAWCQGKALIQEGWAVEMQIPGCTALIASGKETRKNLAEDFYNRARAYDFQSDKDHALADFGEAIRLNQNNADAYGRRGMIYYWAKNDYGRAVADLSHALRLKPDDELFLSYRGQAYLAKGQFALASKDFERLIKLKPDNAGAFLHLSLADNGGGDYDRAIAHADQAIRLSPLSGATEAFDSRGNAHLHQGKVDDAIGDYDSALKLDPTNWQPLYGRGVAKIRTGDTVGGQADIVAAVKLHADAAAEERNLGISP